MVEQVPPEGACGDEDHHHDGVDPPRGVAPGTARSRLGHIEHRTLVQLDLLAGVDVADVAVGRDHRAEDQADDQREGDEREEVPVAAERPVRELAHVELGGEVAESDQVDRQEQSQNGGAPLAPHRVLVCECDDADDAPERDERTGLHRLRCEQVEADDECRAEEQFLLNALIGALTQLTCSFPSLLIFGILGASFRGKTDEKLPSMHPFRT